MKVLVTGGTGMVGSHFMKSYITEGAEVIGIARNSAASRMAAIQDDRIVRCDIMERDALMSYLSFARSISTFVPEHTPRDVNGIVVLSTCSYEYDDARYVVACAPVMFD